MTGFVEEIRRVAAPARSQGNSAPSTDGSQRPAVSSTAQGLVVGGGGQGQRAYADRTARGPAQRGAANDYAYRVQDRLEVKAYRETIAFRNVEAGATVVLDTDVCVTWWVEAAGNVVIQVPDPLPPEDLDPYAEEPSTTVLVTFAVVRKKDATITFPGGWKWSSAARTATGADSPFAAAAADGQEDWFTGMHIPGKGWRGFVTGPKFT